MKQQRHQPLKTLHVGTKLRVPERYLNISWGHSQAANLVCFCTFWDFFYKFCVDVQTCHHKGGVCVYFLKSVKKGHFRNVWVVGGRVGPAKPGWAEARTKARSWCSVNHPGHHAEQGTWGSRTWKHREAGCGRPEDRGVWTAKTVKRPPQQPAQPQYANYWAPLTRKRHILPHPAQLQHTNRWAPRAQSRHQQEHRPQRLTESSDPTQHAKGRTGDCPGPRKETTTRRNVTQGGRWSHF